MRNMESKINIYRDKTITQARTCNSINKSNCPLSNKCLSNNVLFKANITSTIEHYRNKIYHGISETRFKLRYANHQKSFKNRKFKTDTVLYNKIWKVKEKTKNVDTSWVILGMCQSHNTATKRYMLCLNKKIAIALHKQGNILNKRSEIISKCKQIQLGGKLWHQRLILNQ